MFKSRGLNTNISAMEQDLLLQGRAQRLTHTLPRCWIDEHIYSSITEHA